MAAQHQCFSCRDGENENIGPWRLVRITDPDTGKMQARGYLCDDHLCMYADDGYLLTDCNSGELLNV